MPQNFRPRPLKISETEEQKFVVAYIRKFGFEDPLTQWFHYRAERAGLWQALEAKRMGVNTKFPDLHVFRMTNRGWIEMKERGFKDKLARGVGINEHVTAQLAKHEELRANGDWVEICETLEEVQDTLRRHGMPLRFESMTSKRLRAGFEKAFLERSV